MIRQGIAAICALVITTTAFAERTLEERLDRIVEQMEDARVRDHIPGMALAIVKDDKVILARGFGVTDVETGEPVTADTRFAVGSTTKAFTATIVGMLVDEGKMNWDDLVTEYVPEFALTDEEAASRVNLRDVMSHRVGLASMTPLWYGNDVTPMDVIEAASDAEILYPFRTKWNYSNISFLVAGLATSRVEGLDWHTQLRRRLIDPLGMTHANSTLAAAMTDPLMSKGYIWRDEQEELEFQSFRDVRAVAPAGSINASVNDMARWVRFQLNRGEIDGTRLISEESIVETWTKHSEVSPEVDYGLGWFLRERNGRFIVEHAGGIDGFTAEVAFMPEEGVGFVLLMNRIAAPLQETSRQIIFDALLDDWSDEEESAPVENFDEFIGDYIANFGPFKDTVFEVMVRNGNLAVDIPGQTTFELAAPDSEGKRTFLVTDQIAIRFNRNAADQVASLSIFQAGMEFEAPRDGVEIVAEVELDDVRAYLGVYEFEALGDNVEVLIKNGRLAVDVPGQMAYELHAPDEQGRWYYRVTDQAWVQFETDDAGAVTSMTVGEGVVQYNLPRVGDAVVVESDLPSAAELARAIAAAQGTTNGIPFDSIRATGTIRFVNFGIEGTTTMLATSAGDFFTEIDLDKFGNTRIVLDGDSGTIESSMFDLELEGEMLDQAWFESPFTWLNDWRDRFGDIKVVERTTFDDTETYRVILPRGDYMPVTVWVDVKTSLPRAYRIASLSAIGTRFEVTTHLEAYAEVNGLMLPQRIRTENEMSGATVIEWTNSEFDTVDPETFDIAITR